MPKAFPLEFRRDVVAVARKGEAPIAQIAKDFGISQACLHRWLKLADVEDGNSPGTTREESAELRAAIANAESDIDAELATEEAARASAVASIPPDLLSLYENLRTRLDGIGAARLVRGSCSGCHLALPATEVDRIKRVPADEIVRCDQCGRILVR